MTGMSPEDHRRLVVIHGHFYQPPRENPWLGVVERQADAAPAHDWNERVFDECYRPNAFSRLLDADGMIRGIHNNYSSMSFNFGPTLFRWLEDRHPEVVQRILDGDRESRERLAGHGNAVAQVYNHIIMPLASRRDQLTQIRWGKAFFSSRFGREPEGMWLAETAINMATARCLAEEGIRFTILSPAQAEAFRPLDGSHDWRPADRGAVDARRPYRLFISDAGGNLSGAYLDVFFFDPELSKSASFGDLLTDGETFAAALSARLDRAPAWPQAAIVATDGETFGHHRAFGDMCLAFFFTGAAQKHGLAYVNFGYLLEKHPPAFEVRLRDAFGEGTAWSCTHGTGRWTRDCGCSTGARPGWNQAWRAPLREALVSLQRRIDAAYERTLGQLTSDPWSLRDAYIDILHDPSTERLNRFCESRFTAAPLSKDRRLALSRLLEAQKNMLFAFTSCGWFFADVSGIEAIQNLVFACRAIQLGIDRDEQEAATAELVATLGKARSNVPGSTGESLYETRVRPLSRHAEIVAFTLAAERVVCGKTDPTVTYFGYTVHFQAHGRRKVGASQIEVLRAIVQCPLPAEKGEFSVLLSHHEGTAVTGCVIPTPSTLAPGFDLLDPVSWYTHPHVLRLDLSKIFEETRLSLASFLMRRIFERTMRQYMDWLGENEPILDSLALLCRTLPATLAGPITFVLNAVWNRNISLLGRDGRDDGIYTALLDIYRKAKRYNVELDFQESAATLEALLLSQLRHLAPDAASCDRITYLLNIVDRFGIPVRKHIMEDLFYSVLYSGIGDLYRGYRSADRPTQEQKAVLLRVLSFARRMNFSTRQYPIA